MADTGKRKISAKEFLADIRSGMDDAGLQRKYGLTPEALESVYTKLIKAGATKESEIRNRVAHSREERPEPQGQRPAQGTPCPSCNATVPEGSDECPVCGIVLSKFATAQPQAEAAVTEYSGSAVAPSESARKATSVVLSFVVFGLIGVMLVFWATHRGRQKWQAVSRDISHIVEETGNATETPQEVSIEPTPESVNPYDESPALDAGEPGASAQEVGPKENLREEPNRKVTHARRPVATPPEPSREPEYVTGVVRRFTSRDFKKEVVEASKTYPVMFQFYRDT